MFCPGCGCLIPDDAYVCRECGHRISKKERMIVSEKQPTDNGFRSDRTEAATYAILEPVLVIAIGLLILTALFLPWTSDGSSGANILTMQPFSGNGKDLLNYIPVVVIICALLCPLIIFMERSPLLMVPGAIILATMLIYGITGNGSGLGIYLSVFCGIIVFILGVKSNMGR